MQISDVKWTEIPSGYLCTYPRWKDSLSAESSNSLFTAASERAEMNLWLRVLWEQSFHTVL